MHSIFIRNAIKVIFSGQSIGGLDAIIHANYVQSRLSPSILSSVLSDASFFVDHFLFFRREGVDSVINETSDSLP